MPKEPNRAAEMAVFVRAVDLGDFSGAARALGMSPSAVSKLITRLETRLGTRLFRRSTRRLALTAEGEAFLVRARGILDDIETAEREAGGASIPAGRVRVNSSASYVAHMLAPILPLFLNCYPAVTLDIIQSDAITDFVADGTDVAIRAGPLSNAPFFARPLGETRLVTVAAPGWIERHCKAGSVATSRERLGFTYVRASGAWLPRDRGEQERVRVSDGEGMRRLAIAGVAPATLAEFTIREDLAQGRLRRLPSSEEPEGREAFHAVYVGRSDTLPRRVRAFLDFLGQHGRVS